MKNTKSVNVIIRMTEDEKELLSCLAKHSPQGSISELIRNFVYMEGVRMSKFNEQVKDKIDAVLTKKEIENIKRFI